ncbi:maltooligosyl trehalose synthase [Motilibacter rhizosphaerae]|uniref:Maltooligosyl trehalose synthase n=1 Tax=Motilibacter rhizosphaerae TaxID=598652 RepID=A0A4Q7NQZ6_9ACTN|nr:malto-oligosyltrehalose synthase [Motilibacter rhizosphaerae]RZS89476.1 maltooligosyl trehalose synthase [Motilibacter rhizosphaerae]
MPSRPVPTGTYRLQLRPEWGFADLAAQADYLASLGVSHAYLSPILQAVSGSAHGYDVVDHSQLNEELGGAAAFAQLREALGRAGLGAVADVVPNHMAVPTPETANAALWSVLRDGPSSPYARWFDVDWSVESHALLMPILGSRIGEVLDGHELALDRSGAEPVLRYYDHVFPVRPGTEDLPLPQLVDRQWYRLAFWRVADEELNYRRFFDVDTLAGIRVEDEQVFAETHAVLLALVREGGLDGLRIDHPDGLADPGEYLRRLRDATDGAWVVIEKILEGKEQLPHDWPTAGTTGYDALLRVGGVLVDPAGKDPLLRLQSSLTGLPEDFEQVVEESKRYVVEHALYAEVARLVEVAAAVCAEDVHLRDHTRRGLREAIVELLVAFPVYRAYVVPGEEPPAASVELVDEAVGVARAHLPEEGHATLELVRELVLGRLGRGPRRDEFVVRFQQTCGPVMAKGVEDTAFYRWHALVSLNEVGGDPARVGVSPAEWHEWCGRLTADWPRSMTTLSTHDTKRSEDVRARLAVLSELPGDWAGEVAQWRALAAKHRSDAGWPDAATEYLIWQTLVGAWPLPADRLTAYLEKATREAKVHTTWTEPQEDYDTGVREFAEKVLQDSEITAAVSAFVERVHPHFRSNVLAQKLLQLTMPGVPDVYQGTEVVDLSLVDPDNRRPVDYALRRELLAAVDGGERPTTLDGEKLLVTSRAMRLRRELPEAFAGAYEPLETGDEHALAFLRGGRVAVVATRLPAGLARTGFGEAAVSLPDGTWTDVLTGKQFDGGAVALAELLDQLPVALLRKG